MNSMLFLIYVVAVGLVPCVVGNCKFPVQMSGETESIFHNSKYVPEGITLTFSVDLNQTRAIFRSKANSTESFYMVFGTVWHGHVGYLYHTKPNGKCTKEELPSELSFLEFNPMEDTFLAKKNVDHVHGIEYYKGKITIDRPRRGIGHVDQYYGTVPINKTHCYPLFGNLFRTRVNTYSTIGFFYKNMVSTITDSSKLNPDLSNCVDI